MSNLERLKTQKNIQEESHDLIVRKKMDEISRILIGEDPHPKKEKVRCNRVNDQEFNQIEEIIDQLHGSEIEELYMLFLHMNDMQYNTVEPALQEYFPFLEQEKSFTKKQVKNILSLLQESKENRDIEYDNYDD